MSIGGREAVNLCGITLRQANNERRMNAGEGAAAGRR
jgi:hypothetical protein